MDDLLSLAEAAQELGLSPVTLRAQAARGVFRARLVGKTYVTTRAEVERYRRDHLGQVGRPTGYRKWSDLRQAKGAPKDDPG